MNSFTHLHCHSNFSLLYGASRIEELLRSCARSGMDSLALTDRDALYGAIPFYEQALELGIKPVIGCDLSVVGEPPGGRSRVVLLAKDGRGYSNLCRAVTLQRLGTGKNGEADGGRPLPLTELGPLKDGLFALCPDPAVLAELYGIFGSSTLCSLSNDGTAAGRLLAERLIRSAQELGVRTVATNRVAFASPEKYELHRTLCAIRTGTTITRIPPGEVVPPESFLKDAATMRRLFDCPPYDSAPGAVMTAAEVAAECRLELELGRWRFPEVAVPEGEGPFSWLTKLCVEGVLQRYRPLPPEALTRLNFELETIEKMGFTTYFLVVNEIVGFCRERGIPAAGRGSAAGSMVAYALGITCIDPLEHDLYFERFLSPFRDDLPDIDLDISACRRDEVLEFIYERFGHDRTAMICTYATMRSRMAVRDVARSLGLTADERNRLGRQIPRCRADDILSRVSGTSYYDGLPVGEEPCRSILARSAEMEGFPRHLSIHAGGVVISDRPLTDLVPLERSRKGFVVTQYDMGPIERLGLIKIDVLGQKGLSVIEDASRWAVENHGEGALPGSIPRNDGATFRTISEGRTLGVFQVESPAMRSLLQAMAPSSINEVTHALALVRPGASGSGMKERFLRRRAGKEPVFYAHRDLEPILSESFGVFLYQEQVMRAAVALAGFSPAEADELRRAMTHKRTPEQMEALRERFFAGLKARDLKGREAQDLFENLSRFSGYGFCKAHAATYAEFAYKAAFLKTYFPAEFMAAVLVNNGGFYYPAVYLEEARRIGVPVALPDINRSDSDFSVRDGAIYFGLGRIKGVTRSTVETVLAARKGFPFTSLPDFLSRTGTGREEASILIKCGAFDCFDNTRPELLWKLAVLWQRIYAEGPRRCAPRTAPPEAPDGQALPDAGLPIEIPKVSPRTALPRLPDYDRVQRLRMELEYLNASLSAHPMEILVPEELGRGVNSASLSRNLGREVTMAGWVITRRRARTKTGEFMQFLTLEDPHGIFEAVLFPADLERAGAVVRTSQLLRITGTVSTRFGSLGITAKRVEALDEGRFPLERSQLASPAGGQAG